MLNEPPEPDDGVLLYALNSMEEALVAYDADGRLLFCNRAFLVMYGYTPQQARPGVHFRELGEIDIRQGNVVVEDEKGEDYLERKAAYRKSLTGSFTVKLRDGRWIRTTDRRMPNGGFVSVHVDITEIKETQERMCQAQETARLHQEELARLNESLETQVAERTRALERAMREAEALARTDPLTGLKNRRAFFDMARLVHDAAMRYGHRYSVIMVDLDHFKKINDTHGHSVGDRALKAIAETLCGIVRAADVAGRIGGEEFAVVLPETSGQNVVTLAERLRVRISAITVPSGKGALSVTVSIGIADSADGDASVEDVMTRADAALYRAKAEGRNRVAVAAS